MTGLVFWAIAWYSASEGEVLLGGRKVLVRRTDDPIGFWTVILIIVLVGAAAIAFGVLMRDQPYHLRGTPLPPG
jgi:hypothetical protein